ncbi:hypothetical protein NI465_12085 [Acinetobacter lwoffii]|uniref:hypothetical protein n=1 Tax=Acinetobacter lwoffii TaxID=28090 RepID=UPI00209B6708|nr:hypothetical protein [Acinetobacter lwoffii]MCO8114910.1 hypothetical protein [Acinetobacter lwoffii]
MNTQNKEALIAEIERFKAEALKMHIVQVLADTYTNTDLFDYNLDSDGSVIWYKAQARQLWEFWQAKAQAVPEWAVIVPKLSANYLFNTVPELGFEHQDQKDTVLYHLNYMASEFRDSAKQFVEDDHAKQKTMIELQEPAND